MNYAMEIHDSTLLDFAVHSDGAGFLLFHAVICRSKDRLFNDAMESGWQNLRLDFKNMTVEGDLLRDTYSLDGDVTINGVTTDGFLYLPADHSGEIVLRFNQAEDFAMRSVRASGMRSCLEGEFVIETYWNADGGRRSASA